MASDEVLDPNELFATATGSRNKPQRTYSHKGKNSRAAVRLPALKPAPKSPIPANTGVRLKRFCIGYANSSELRPALPVPIEELPIQTQEAEEEANGDGINYDNVDEIDPHSPAGLGETISFSPVTDNEQIVCPSSSTRYSQVSSDSEEPEDPEVEENDVDELTLISQRPLGSIPKHDRRTGNGTRSLRRRPFLIFDKTESKGYKQLKISPQVEEAPPALRYQPGDGFSGREAKPNGSNLLTRSGKQAITNPHVGILDLTQSEPGPAKQKRSIRRAGLEDNSFAPEPKKKKARRPLAPKNPNQQPRPKDPNQQSKSPGPKHQPTSATKSPSHVKENSPALTTPDAPKTAARPAQQPETGDTKPEQQPPQDPITENPQPHPTTAQQIPPKDNNDEVDMIIAKSDDIDSEDPSTALKAHDTQGDEGQDSCETHVTDSPPHWQLRVRARSVSPEPSEKPDAAGKEPRALGPRVFRRVWTQ